MKKLMIAAAAAAMIGGAQAAMVYDFSASLKTTEARTSTQSANYSYYFGFAMNDANEYWWSSPVIHWETSERIYASWNGYARLIKRDSNTGKGTIQGSVWNKLSQEEKLQFVDDLKEYGNYFYDDQPAKKSVTDPSYTDPGFAGHKEVYKGKKQWCLTIKWSNKVTDTSCYRVAGSVKLAGQYWTSDCCGGENSEWYADWSGKNASPEWLYDEQAGTTTYDITLRPVFNYRFGALTLDKATKVEFVAGIGADDQLPQLVLAGQGSVATLKDKYNQTSTEPEISSISGNIVGVWIDPVCEVCCGGNGDAVVFACMDEDTLWNGMGVQGGEGARASKNIKAAIDEDDAKNVAEPIWNTGWIDNDGDPLWGTAAFGTFTLKYNQKASSFIQ